MQSSPLPMIFILALFSLPYAHCARGSHSSLCTDDFTDIYKGMLKGNTTKCRKLTTLQAQIAWNNHITMDNETCISVLIGTKMISSTGWLAWGVNPDRPQMVGTRAIIAIINGNFPVVHTYNITKDTKLHCALKPSDIDVTVHNKEAEYNKSTGLFTMSATLTFPKSYNVSSLNHVWQVGNFLEGLEPKMHLTSLQNLDSKETLDMKTGSCQNSGHHRQHLRKVHGILNMMGWGTLLPIGVIIARYFKEFPIKLEDWWFFLHFSCQVLGYTLGSIGWGLGLLLGHQSKHYTFHTHRVLGICIFGFTTLQMLAFRLKPTKEDEYRKHWNVYHHFLGYSLLVMIPVNIYQGIKILKPDNRAWKWAYNGILVFLAFVVLALEIFTWAKFCLNRRKHHPETGNQTPETSDNIEQKHDPQTGKPAPKTS